MKKIDRINLSDLTADLPKINMSTHARNSKFINITLPHIIGPKTNGNLSAVDRN
jgi:hypothetical protein